MIPFYFGADDQRLYGVYEAAHDSGAVSRAAVLCNPVGNEYIQAHRTMRNLSSRLSKAGFHVLRFDYYGTGDSSGGSGDGSPQRWCENIETAMMELQEMTGAARMSLIGLRFGANLAARVAARPPAVINSLALWEPLSDKDGAVAQCTDHDATALAEFLTMESGRVLPARTLVLMTAEEPRAAVWKAVDVKYVPSPSPWLDGYFEPKVIPVDALSYIVKWLKA
jgi:alpha-beta hydrolase superfamily lysophospholipase